jgi:hypothetical protein
LIAKVRSTNKALILFIFQFCTSFVALARGCGPWSGILVSSILCQHLDEMAVLIAGGRFWPRRAVDDEGEDLDLLVQRRRDKSSSADKARKWRKRNEAFDAPRFAAGP